MTKKDLITKISEITGSEEGLSTLKKADLEKKLNDLNAISSSGEKPKVTDPEWTEWVMSQFDTFELKDGMPTCDSLRRIFKLLIGDIIDTYIDVIKAPTQQDQTTTVSCSISYKKHGDESDTIYRVSDAFDVNQDNTPFPFNKVSVASAATKAEARSLRKALGLIKVYASEEIQEGVEAKESLSSSVSDEGKLISDAAKTAIITMSQRMGIDMIKLCNSMDFEVDLIDNLSYVNSHKVIAKLNEYSRGEDNGGESIPDEIKNEVIF